MILLIDTTEYLIEDIDYYKITNIDTENIKLKKILDILYFISKEKLINEIKQILVINIDGTKLFPKKFIEKVNSTKNILPNGIDNSIKEHIFNLFKSIKILNLEDTEISIEKFKFKKLVKKREFEIWRNKLLNSFKHEEVIILGGAITPLILLLLEFYPNVIAFKRKFFYASSSDRFIKYVNVGEQQSDYLEYYKNYYRNSFPSLTYSYLEIFNSRADYFLTPFDDKNFKSMHLNLFKSFSECLNKGNQKILFWGKDLSLAFEYLKSLQDIMGKFYYFNCSDGKFKVEPGKQALIFDSVEKLSRTEFSRLISDLSTGEYSIKNVFLLSKEYISHDIFQVFKLISVPPFKTMMGSYGHFFRYTILDKQLVPEKEIIKFNDIYSHLIRGKLLKPLFNQVKDFFELGDLLNDLVLRDNIKKVLYHPDFWYELLRNYPQINSLDHNDKLEEYASEYVLNKRKNGKFQVIFNGKNLHFENNSLDGFLYLNDLFEHPNQVRTGTELFQLKVGVNHSDRKDRVKLTDKKTIKQTLNEIGVLKKNKQEQIDLGNAHEALDIQDEIDKLFKYINNNTKFDKNDPSNIWKPKTTASRSDNEWRNVRGAINRLKSEISGIDDGFYKYLNRTIIEDSQTRSYRYVPEPNIRWKISSQ